MKKNRLITVILALVLLASLSGVQGQYATPSKGNLASATNASAQYSQYYTMNAGTVPSTHIGVPQQTEIAGNMPNTVYFSNQMQAVPFAQYQSSPTYSESNSLWAKGSTDWSQYVVVPVGANVSLLAISPKGGSGTLNLVDANGQTYSYNYFFYPKSQLSFYADAPGRHTLSFSIGGITSNPVVIDVTGTVSMTYNPVNNYFPPTSNYNPQTIGYYSPPISNYPGYYEPYSYNGPQAALDLADANKAYQKLFGNYYNGDWNYGIYSWLNSYP